MKRWLCLCLCAGLTFGAVGCGNTTEPTEPTEQTAQQTQEQETEQEETVDQETERMDDKEIEEIKERQNKALKEYYEICFTGEDEPIWAKYINDASVQLSVTGIQTLMIEVEKGTDKSTAQSIALVLLGFDTNNEVYAVNVVSPDGQEIFWYQNPAYQKQNKPKTVNADDFFTAMNDGFTNAGIPTLDTWTKEQKDDGTIEYKYTLDGQFVDVSYESNGGISVSYWGDPQSNFTQMWATSMIQAIKYFEGDDIQSVVDQLQLLSIAEGEKMAFGKNGNTYIFVADSVRSFSDRNNVSCILMIN